MATQKVTFTLPQDLATDFLRRVPPSSRFPVRSLSHRSQTREGEEQLVRACKLANNSADVLDIETSFDNTPDDLDRMHEQW